MAISGSQKAYTYARSGIARSGATRSNYVLPWSTVDLIVRDGAGNIISRTDITPYIRFGSLQVTQALNDEADTCSFQIVPTAPANAVPAVGQEIAVAWTPGNEDFRGFALVVQFDRRVMNESPWVSVQCQDAMWRFDARIVTYRFPAQSVSLSIQFLVQWFCNLSGTATSPGDFRTTFVQPGMASIPAFDVVNQRPSTVMRTLVTAVQGGFYVDGLELHAWAGGLSEPQQTNPQPLTNTLATLKAFRLTQDATQLRKRVLVEGRRTSTLMSYPTVSPLSSQALGIPVQDATIFSPTLPGYDVRIGTQWMLTQYAASVTAQGVAPPQTHLHLPYAPGDLVLTLEPMPVAPPSIGWIRVGNQLSRYLGYAGDPLTGVWTLDVPGPEHLYSQLTVPFLVGEIVEWVDAILVFTPAGLGWPEGPLVGDVLTREQPTDTPVVTLASTTRSLDGWPPLEGFVQDGRYSYAGALARANADLDAFAEPLVSADWETDDLNAQPGRQQVINLTGPSVVNTTLTITRVEVSFPLRTLPPRRRCTGGDVKPSTFLDLVVTDDS